MSTFNPEFSLLAMAERSHVVRLTTTAAFAWLFWDWVIQLDEEVHYVWHKKWSTSKFLYILTRYFGMMFVCFEMVAETRSWSTAFCEFYFPIVGVGSCLLIFIVEIGMQFRVYALYNCSRKLLAVNTSLFLIEVVVISAMLGLDIAWRTSPFNLPFGSDILTGCWSYDRPHFTFAPWIIALAYELYLFTLVAWKAYGKYSRDGSFVGIFRLMFRDAVIWFVIIAALLAWNAFTWIVGPNGEVFIGLAFLHSCACSGGCRLLLNLRKAYFVAEGDPKACLGTNPTISIRRHPSSSNHDIEMVQTRETHTIASPIAVFKRSTDSYPPFSTRIIPNVFAQPAMQPPPWMTQSRINNTSHINLPRSDSPQQSDCASTTVYGYSTKTLSGNWEDTSQGSDPRYSFRSGAV